VGRVGIMTVMIVADQPRSQTGLMGIGDPRQAPLPVLIEGGYVLDCITGEPSGLTQCMIGPNGSSSQLRRWGGWVPDQGAVLIRGPPRGSNPQ